MRPGAGRGSRTGAAACAPSTPGRAGRTGSRRRALVTGARLVRPGNNHPGHERSAVKQFVVDYRHHPHPPPLPDDPELVVLVQVDTADRRDLGAAQPSADGQQDHQIALGGRPASTQPPPPCPGWGAPSLRAHERSGRRRGSSVRHDARPMRRTCGGRGEAGPGGFGAPCRVGRQPGPRRGILRDVERGGGPTSAARRRSWWVRSRIVPGLMPRDVMYVRCSRQPRRPNSSAGSPSLRSPVFLASLINDQAATGIRGLRNASGHSSCKTDG